MFPSACDVVPSRTLLHGRRVPSLGQGDLQLRSPQAQRQPLTAGRSTRVRMQPGRSNAQKSVCMDGVIPVCKQSPAARPHLHASSMSCVPPWLFEETAHERSSLFEKRKGTGRSWRVASGTAGRKTMGEAATLHEALPAAVLRRDIRGPPPA
jgi:hypothetical protein